MEMHRTTIQKVFILTAILALLVTGVFAVLKTYERYRITPPVEVANAITVEVPDSRFQIPVIIDLDLLERYINTKLTGTFLTKTIFTGKSKKDEVQVRLSRTDPLSITSNGKELTCTFPLEVDATLVDMRLGKIFAGLFRPLHTSIVIQLSTPVDIDKNWNLVTRFRITGYTWKKKPLLHIGPFRKDMTTTFNRLIEEKGRKLTAMLDREIHKEVSLYATVADVWKDLQEPIIIKKKQPKAWLNFECTTLDASITLDKHAIICTTGINARMRILTDSVTANIIHPLPVLQKNHTAQSDLRSKISLYARSSFKDINEQLQQLLEGKTFSREGHHITIRKIRTYGSVNGLTVDIVTDKAFEGHLFMSGKPEYDTTTKKIIIRNFDYDLTSGSLLARAGDDLLHQKIRDEIATKLTLNLDSLISSIPDIGQRAISKSKAGKSIDMSIGELDIEACSFLIGRDNVHALINATTELSIRIKQIKAGKAITITDG